MPHYRSARHGVQLSWEYLEAAFTARVDRPMLHTFELFHPLIGRRRFVADEVNLMATLEPDAPEDGGVEVEWLAAPLTVNRPEQSDSAASPETSLSLDNVAGLMQDALDTTRGSTDPWELTERIYAADDTGGPAVLPPVTTLLSKVGTQDAAVVLTASYGDFGNVSVPRTTFKRAEYPLQR